MSELMIIAHRKIDGKVNVNITVLGNREPVWSGDIDLSSPKDIKRAAKVIANKIPAAGVEIVEKKLSDIDSLGLDLIDEKGRIWTEPRPLPNPLPEVMPYDPAMMPPVVSDLIMDAAHRMQCPPDFIACGLLVAMGVAIGNRIAIRPKSNDPWTVSTNLWGIVIGRPSLMKSPSIAVAANLLRFIERRDAESLASVVGDACTKRKVNDAKRKVLQKELNDAVKSSPDDVDGHLAIAKKLSDIESVVIPSSRRLVTSDSTMAKLVELLNTHFLGMTLWVDEITGWMKDLDRDGSTGDRPRYLTMWNANERINVDRIERGETFCDRPFLSVFGCATPGGIADYVKGALTSGAGDDGLLQRFQVTVWPDDPGDYEWVDAEPDRVAMQKVRDLFIRLASLDSSRLASKDCDVDDNVPWMAFSPDAQDRFAQWAQDIGRRCRSKTLPEAIESHLGKYHKLAASIALIIELAEGPSPSVTLQSVERALRWVDYLESHAMRIYGFAACPERSLAPMLIRKLVDWDADRPIRVRHIRQKGWSGLSDPRVIEATLAALEDDGWVQSFEDGKTDAGGRPTRSYAIHPWTKKLLPP